MTAVVNFRIATAEDAGQLTAFATRTFIDTYAPFNTAADIAHYLGRAFSPERQRAELIDPTLITWVGEANGEMAAYAQLRQGEPPISVESERAIELQRLYVDRAFHGHGVATELMALLVEHAGMLGVEVLWLGVWQRNERALAFYRKSGFTVVGEQTFRLGADLQDDWVMARRLEG